MMLACCATTTCQQTLCLAACFLGSAILFENAAGLANLPLLYRAIPNILLPPVSMALLFVRPPRVDDLLTRQLQHRMLVSDVTAVCYRWLFSFLFLPLL